VILGLRFSAVEVADHMLGLVQLEQLLETMMGEDG
jgi:hypothetical protein